MVSYHMTEGSWTRKSSQLFQKEADAWVGSEQWGGGCLFTSECFQRVERQSPEGAEPLHHTEYRTLQDENAEVETFSPRWCDLKSLSLSERDTLLTLCAPHHTLQDKRDKI